MKKVVCISGSRADYHLMEPVFAALSAHLDLTPELVVTCAHLHPDFKNKSNVTLRDFHGPRRTVNMLLAEDSGCAMAQSLGIGIYGMAQAFLDMCPDIVLLQGDRGEMLAAAIAAAHMNTPVVHMSGGDLSGSIDNSIRNAITSFSHIHLTTCIQSTQRLLAMGESPARISEVGEPALDRIRSMDFIPREELFSLLKLDPRKPVISATLHPVTTRPERAAAHIRQLLAVLEEIGHQTVLTAPNTDTGYSGMQDVIRSFSHKPFLRVTNSLGFVQYISLLRHAEAMVGNSSSGILEAPSLGLPVVNVGDRQFKRLRAANVIDVEHDGPAIKNALLRALMDQEFRQICKECVNPYGDGHAAKRTIKILASLRTSPELINKWLPVTGSLFDDGL